MSKLDFIVGSAFSVLCFLTTPVWTMMLSIDFVCAILIFALWLSFAGVAIFIYTDDNRKV